MTCCAIRAVHLQLHRPYDRLLAMVAPQHAAATGIHWRLGWVWLAFGAFSANAAAPDSNAGSGVQGVVTMSPCAGAQREGADCRGPYADVEVRLLSGSVATAATVRTSSEGRYRLAAPPGTYQLKVMPAIKFIRCPSPTLVVKDNAYTVADIDCDSGMR